MAYVHLDGTVVHEEVVGSGGSGVIIRDGDFAVKIPRLWLGVDVPEDGRLTPKEGGFDMRQCRIEQINEEKAIFLRLGGFRGIVPCFGLNTSDHSIRMKYMKNGDLRSYLERENPEKKMKLLWLKDIAQTLAHIHRCRIIATDVRLDNMLLDDDLSVKLTDFGESILMPPDWDMKEANEHGESALTDIGQFGAVMFEIVTGQRCRFDLLQDWKEPGDLFTWPRRESLPSTHGVWLGDIIEACWRQGSFATTDELAAALDEEYGNAMKVGV